MVRDETRRPITMDQLLDMEAQGAFIELKRVAFEEELSPAAIEDLSFKFADFDPPSG